MDSKGYKSNNQSKDTCCCKVCEVGNSFGLDYKKLKSKIMIRAKAVKESRCCPKCFTLLYSGCSHTCNKSQWKMNIKAAADEVTKEEIANEVIKSKITASNKGEGQSVVRL